MPTSIFDMILGNQDPMTQRLGDQGFSPDQIEGLQKGALSGPQDDPGSPGPGGVSNQQMVIALMLQGMQQNAQRLMQSQNPNVRGFAEAQMSALPLGNALAQMPLLRAQQAQQDKEAALKALSTAATIRLKSQQTEESAARTADIPIKRDQNQQSIDVRKGQLELDSIFETAKLELKKQGLLNDQTANTLRGVEIQIKQGALDAANSRLAEDARHNREQEYLATETTKLKGAQKNRELDLRERELAQRDLTQQFHQKSLELRMQQTALEIKKAQMADPQFDHMIEALKLLPADQRKGEWNKMLPVIEQKLGIVMEYPDGVLERLLPNFLGGKTPQYKSTTQGTTKSPSTTSAEDDLMGQITGE